MRIQRSNPIEPSRTLLSKNLRAGSRWCPLLAGAGLLAVSAVSLPAATFTWDAGNVGAVTWSAGSWSPGVPVSDVTNDLIFLGIDPNIYDAVNETFGFQLNALTLNSTATGGQTISGFELDFTSDGVDTPAITQSGSGAFTISTDIFLVNALTLGGTGTGVTTLSGIISGGSGITVTGATWKLENNFSTFTGGLTVGTGATVELAPGGGGTQSVNIAPAASSIIGSNSAANPLVINGGTLKLTTSEAGNITFGDNRALTFGANGGTLDLRNSGTAGGGNIAQSGNNDLALTLNNTAGNVAVIKFSGGQNGLSTNTTNSGDWSANNNTLRIESYAGTGALRVELENGATFQNKPGTTGVPLTVRGTVGGDPTSGPSALVNANLSLNMGRMMLNDQGTFNYPSGLTFAGAVQVAVTGSTRAFDGNLTVANGGFISFSGRSTGGAMGAIINNPGTGTNTANQNPLWIGQGGNDTLTIQSGGLAVFDSRVRHDQANNNGVLLNARAIIQGGGELRIQQSLSRATAAQATAAGQSNANSTTSNAGVHIIDGAIEGQGSTASESILNILLPIQPGADTNADQVPDSAFGDLGGVVFRTASNLVINGTGFGGLRVVGNPRPNNLFSPSGADPVTNVTKVNNLLTTARVNALTGTGGYLTVAPTNQSFTFPNAEWAAGQPVGLKVVNQATGVDLAFPAAKTSWGHNLAIDTGAELSTGTSAFSLNGGTLFGNGTLSGSGGLTVGAAAGVAPGLSIGTLTVGNITLNGTLTIETTNGPTSDLLAVGGNLTLGGSSVLTLPVSNTYANVDYTLATYTGTLTGTFGSTGSLPPDFALDYGTGANSAIKLIYAPVPILVWNGNVSGAWNTATANWQGGATFSNGNKVVFDETASGPNYTVVISGGDVSPALITVNNSAHTYELVSSAGNAIVGAAQLIKTGSGVLILSGPATYSGGTTINQGTVRLGADNSLPDTGLVSVAAGAILSAQGFSDTVGDLTVNGFVTGSGTLTVGSLTLGSGVVFLPQLLLNGNVTQTAATSATLTNFVSLGSATRTFNVAADAELTVSGAISDGGLTKTGSGTLVLDNATNNYSDGTTVADGTLRIGVAGALPAATALTVNGGTLDGNNTAIDVSSLSGTGGTISAGSGSLTVNQTATTTFNGAITGVASVTKTGTGSLTLGGNSNYSGGLFVNEGKVALTGVNGGGAGIVTVNPNGKLQINVPINNRIDLNGGTLFAIGGPASVTNNDLVATAGTTSTISLSDPDNVNTRSEVILLGTLKGSGDINVVISTNAPHPDGGVGLRLRGTGLSDYSGIITSGQQVKTEVQTGQAGPFSPAGTGRFVFTGGQFTGGLNGTYSQFNIRNNFAGNTIIGNDVEVTGLGFVNMNLAGGAALDAITQMGNLKIGASQILGVNKNGAPNQILFFPTVTLTGGEAVFEPTTPGFGASGTSDLSLGPISETTAGSGFLMAGQTNLILMGANAYTGPTTIISGTIRLGAAGALPATTDLTVNGGTLDLANLGVGFDQTVNSLSGAGGTITNNDFIEQHTLTVDQDATTTYSGSLSGSLTLRKSGTGTLTLNGGLFIGNLEVDDGVLNLNSPLTFSTLTAEGGTLNVNADISNSIVNANAGTVNISISETISELNIGANGVVVLAAGGPAPVAAEMGNMEMDAPELNAAPGSVQAVPEPGSVSLLVCGVLGLLARRRKGTCA